jgi:FkbM family methyltransferase
MKTGETTPLVRRSRVRNETDNGTSGNAASEKAVKQADGGWRHALVQFARRLPGISWTTAPYRRLLDTVNIVERRIAIAEARLHAGARQETRGRMASERVRDAHLQGRLDHLEASLASLAGSVERLADESASRLQRMETAAATQADLLQALRQTSARRGTYIGNDRMLFTTIYGHIMLCDANDLSLTPTLLEHGHFEPGTTQVFLKLVHEGMNVVEIGANIGYYTVLGGHRVRPTGKYIAFEPSPRAFALLDINVGLYNLYDCVEVVNMAVFDTATKLTLHTYSAQLGYTSLHRIDNARFERAFGYNGSFTAAAVSLDNYLADAGLRIDLVKIDAERSEPHILRGMQRTLASTPDIQVIFEAAPNTFSEGDVERYRTMGFRFWRIDYMSGALTPIETFARDAAQTLHLTDILMSRKDDPFAG